MSRSSILAEIIGLMATQGANDILTQAFNCAMLGNIESADDALSVFYEVAYGSPATATN